MQDKSPPVSLFYKPSIKGKRASSRSVLAKRASHGPEPETVDNKKLKWHNHSKESIASKPDKRIEGRCQVPGCDCTLSPKWRDGPAGRNTLCNRCGLLWERRQRGESEPKRKYPSDDSFSQSLEAYFAAAELNITNVEKCKQKENKLSIKYLLN